MEAWIQKHDLSSEPITDPTMDQCLAVLGSFDWEAELKLYEVALEENRDRCPPGIEMVDRDRTLQVMPIHDRKSHYNYSCDHPVRLFNLFGASKNLNAWAISDDHRERLIGFHFAGDEKQETLVHTLMKLSEEV